MRNAGRRILSQCTPNVKPQKNLIVVQPASCSGCSWRVLRLHSANYCKLEIAAYLGDGAVEVKDDAAHLCNA